MLELNPLLPLTDTDDDSPTIASFDVDSQGRARWFFQYVGLWSVDEARMVRGAVAGYGTSASILAPDNQRPHLIELYGVWPDTLARLRRRIVLDAVPGTSVLAQAAYAPLDIIGEARRSIGRDITCCYHGEGN